MKLSHILFWGLLIPAIGCSKKSGNDTGDGGGTTPCHVATNPDKTQLLARQNISLLFSNATNQNTTINVDTTSVYQSIDGFGFCLTGRSATLINNLPAAQSNAR
jgi:glucosylceramidase